MDRWMRRMRRMRRYWPYGVALAILLSFGLGWWQGAAEARAARRQAAAAADRPGAAAPVRGSPGGAAGGTGGTTGGAGAAGAAVPAFAPLRPGGTPAASGSRAVPAAPAPARGGQRPPSPQSAQDGAEGRSGEAPKKEAAAAPIQHKVEEGETAWEIAQRYGVSLAALAAANPDVSDLDRLQVGQVLTLPRDARPGGGGAELSEKVRAALARPGTFVWPVRGSISDPYGYRIHPITGRLAFHTGIDIAADFGDPIRAARAGTVGYAGWVNGYGNTVILDHPDGTRTLYGHASRLEVKEGDRVTQGQIIARVGSTGNSTGPHLHFEIIAGRPIDPLPYLP